MDATKAQLGKNATVIWLIGGAVLFLLDGGIRNLLSLRAAAFLLIGMFVAAIVVGAVSYAIIRKMAESLMNKYGDPSSDEAQAAMRSGRLWFAIINIALSALFVLWVYASLFWA